MTQRHRYDTMRLRGDKVKNTDGRLDPTLSITQPDQFQPGETCAVFAQCRNAPAQCWTCAWPEEALRPTQYLPRDPKVEHPLTTQLKQAVAARRKAAKRSTAAQQGRANRRKGVARERELAKALGGTRQPLSGALRGNLSNDVVLPDGLNIEVKSRAQGFRTIYGWVLDEVEKPDAVALKANNQPWLIVQTLENWQAGRQPATVDLKKLQEALRLLEEAIR